MKILDKAGMVAKKKDEFEQELRRRESDSSSHVAGLINVDKALYKHWLVQSTVSVPRIHTPSWRKSRSYVALCSKICRVVRSRPAVQRLDFSLVVCLPLLCLAESREEGVGGCKPPLHRQAPLCVPDD